MKINLDKNEFHFDFQSWNQFDQYKLGITLITSIITTPINKNKMVFNIKKHLVALCFLPLQEVKEEKQNAKEIDLNIRDEPFFYLSYRFLLKSRIHVYSEKLWFNDFIHKHWMFETFFDNLKSLKKINYDDYQPFLFNLMKWNESNIRYNIFSRSLISFSQKRNQQDKIKQKEIVWSLLETFVTKVSQNLFCDKIHYLNMNFHFLLLKSYSSYCLQFYCFFLLQYFKILQMQNLNFKNPFFKEKQVFKKILLQSLLTGYREYHLSLTNELLIAGRTIYDHLENLYELLKKKPKWLFRMDFLNNDIVLFDLPVFTWICSEKHPIFRSFSETLYLFKTIVTDKIFKNQIIYLLNPFLSKRLEKHLIYNYYRSYKTNHHKIQKQIIIFKNSILHISDDAYMNMESFIVFKKWFSDYGLKWKNPKFFHSYFSFLNQKSGVDFYGFYLSQNRIDPFFSKNSKNLMNKCFKNRILLKTRILPSKFYLLRYLNLLKKTIKQSTTCSQELLIQKLKTLIERWSFYYRVSTNKKIFHFCDSILFKWIWKWACRRHPNKSRNWIKKKYYISNISTNIYKKNKWSFCIYNSFSKKWSCLPEHQKIKLIRHIKIRRYLTFYNENWKYWLKRFPI